MDEEKETEQTSEVLVETQTQASTQQETAESFPRIEDLRKSEQEVKTAPQVEGVTKVERDVQPLDRVFAKKSDKKKIYMKKRLKIVTAVYSTVVALLLGFVITNIVTLSMLNKQVTTNTKTIQSAQQQVVEMQDTTAGSNLGDFTISLNEPRDYSEDKKELTFLDKITILFRNLFG